MESQMFNDLRKALRDANEVWVPGDQTLKSLAKAVSKHANKSQAAELLNEFPGVFGKRAGKLVVKSGGKTDKTKNSASRTRSGRKPRKQNLYRFGRYGTEPQAKAAAQQLMTPDAISYQSALFPNPKDYGVTVEIVEATPAKAEGGNPLYPWTLDVNMKVIGDTERKAKWLKSFKEKLAAQV